MKKFTRIIVASIAAAGSIFVAAPPAQAHCDDPHGAVEETVCGGREFVRCLTEDGAGVVPITTNCDAPVEGSN